jgi:hypothetical protein
VPQGKAEARQGRRETVYRPKGLSGDFISIPCKAQVGNYRLSTLPASMNSLPTLTCGEGGVSNYQGPSAWSVTPIPSSSVSATSDSTLHDPLVCHEVPILRLALMWIQGLSSLTRLYDPANTMYGKGAGESVDSRILSDSKLWTLFFSA